MGIIKRQASKSSWTSLIGVAVSAASALYVIPTLPSKIYGTVSIVIGVASLLLPFTLLGLNSTYLRFNESYSESHREGVFRKFYIAHTTFSVLLSICFYFASNWFLTKFYNSSDLPSNTGVYISFMLFFMGQFTLLSSYITSKYRLNVVRIAELIFQKLGIPVIFLIYIFFNLSTTHLLLLLSLLYLLRAISLVYFKHRYATNRAQIRTTQIKLNKATVPYSIFALLAVILHQAIIDIDTLMVGSLVGVSEAGIYKYAFYIAIIIDLPRINLVSLLFPLISKYQHENNNKKLNEIYKRSSNLLFSLGCIMLLFILPSLDDFFSIIPNGDNFKSARMIIIYISLAKLFNMLMGVNFEIIASSKNYLIMLAINLIALIVVIIANLALIPPLGADGAALATLIVWIIYNSTAMLYLKHKYQLFPFSTNTLKIFITAVVAFLIIYQIPITFNSSFLNIAFRSLITMPFVFVFYKLKLSTDLNDQINKYVKPFTRNN